jgi:hypothetical protein
MSGREPRDEWVLDESDRPEPATGEGAPPLLRSEQPAERTLGLSLTPC